MTVQNEVWLITLAGMGLVALAFIYVIAKSGKPADASAVQKKAYAIRRWWFLALVLTGIGVTWASLRQFPIRRPACAIARHADRRRRRPPMVMGTEPEPLQCGRSGGISCHQRRRQSWLRDLRPGRPHRDADPGDAGLHQPAGLHVCPARHDTVCCVSSTADWRTTA